MQTSKQSWVVERYQHRRWERCATGLSALIFVVAGCGGDSQPGPTEQQPNVPGWLSLASARDALAGGSDDVPLSVDGSWRYSRTRSGDEITGESVSVDGRDLLTWQHSGASSSGAADGQGDGVVERRYEITRGAGSDGTIVITDDPQDDGTPLARTTYARAGDKVHVTIEKANSSGALAVADEYDTTAKQALGPGQPSSPFHSSCSADDIERLTPILVEGVTKGMQCLQKLGLHNEAAQLAGKLGSEGMQIRCEPLPNNECAEVDFTDSLLRGAVSGPIGITVDTNTFFNNVFCASNQASGVFHELLHVTFGPHSPGAKPSTDRTYSCQRLCFNADEGSTPQVTRCQCALCLGTDECDERCKSFPDCGDKPPACQPDVAIDDATCSPVSCKCGNDAGKRFVQTMRGTASGPVGTLVQVNVASALGGTLECGDWPAASCPIANVLKCCQRTSAEQAQQVRWTASQPTPDPRQCICPPISLPGVNWVAQVHMPGKSGFVEIKKEVEKTGPTCQ